MKVWYSGSNVYNQIISRKELIVEDFTACEYELLEKIAFGYTYAVIRSSNDVQFHGGVNKNTQIKKIDNIEKIACADNITFILYQDGTICRIDSATAETRIIPNFITVENPDDQIDYIVDIACGKKISAAVSKRNRVFNIPNKLKYEGRKVKQIVAGHEHSLILDSNGDVFSFGCGIRGQLGHGTLENETNPKLIEALAGIKINKIAAGGWHSCAISATGDLYIWGWNSDGQLALPSNRNVSVLATPEPVCLEDPDCNVDDVACGSKHTIIHIGTQIYGTGWNKYKQLGNAGEENVYTFKFLKDFNNEKIISLQCGPWCTAIITE